MDEYNVVDLMAQESILRCFSLYGLEGTLEKIEELSVTPDMLDVMKRNYFYLINRKK